MRIKIIACEVLAPELERLGAESSHQLDVHIQPFGLHREPEKLRQDAQEAIDAAGGHGFDYIVLGYGICSNGTVGLAARTTPIVIPRAHDCITFALGSRERYAEEFRQAPGTYYYTCGWIDRKEEMRPDDIEQAQREARERSKYEEYVAKYGEDNAKYLLEVEGAWKQHYSRAAFINQGLGDIERYREFTRGIAERNGWEYAELPGDAALLRKLVGAEWSEEDFLVLRPGETLEATYDGGLIRAKRQ